MRLCSSVEYGPEVRVTAQLRRAVSRLKAEVESDSQLQSLHAQATENARRAGLEVVPDPMYGEGVVNKEPLAPCRDNPEQPLALYCGAGYTLIVNHFGVPGITRQRYDFLCGVRDIHGVDYQFTLRAPASPPPGDPSFPSYKFNHRCPVNGDTDERLPVFMRGPDGFQVAVVYAPYRGLRRPGMHLEFNYGAGYWETLAQLKAKGANPKRIMWCVCRYREGKPCPMKRGRLMPPRWKPDK